MVKLIIAYSSYYLLLELLFVTMVIIGYYCLLSLLLGTMVTAL
jgi:hypothetical protein